MQENREKKLHIGLFAAFVFLQFTVLWLGNRAGEGYLSTERREHVYYAIQVFVILGFLAYAAADGLIRGERPRRRIAAAVLALFTVGAGVMLPGYLLFAVIGDRDRGRLVPVAALCVTLAALLNAALTEAYWLNMCLFYVALSGAVSFYNLTFWRLAPETRHPALRASAGRMLDSGVVLAMGLLRTSLLSPAAVQVLSVAGLAGVILLLTASGGFNLSPPPVPAAVPVPAPLLPDDALDRMREQYALTPRETEVLRELVLTEDKQAVIGARMEVNVKTIQKYVTQIYRKTGAATRSGLTDLYRDAAAGR